MFSFICVSHHSSPPVTPTASPGTEYTVSGTNTKLLLHKNTFPQKRAPAEVKGQSSCVQKGFSSVCARAVSVLQPDDSVEFS